MHKICGVVVDSPTANPIAGALVVARTGKSTQECDASAPYADFTNELGRFSIDVPEAPKWEVQAKILGITSSGWMAAAPGTDVCLEVCLTDSFEIKLFSTKECGTPEECPSPVTGKSYEAQLIMSAASQPEVDRVEWRSHGINISSTGDFRANVEAPVPTDAEIAARVIGKPSGRGTPVLEKQVNIPFRAAPVPAVTRVALQRASVRPTLQQGLWTLIRANSKAIGFPEYHEFINRVLCRQPSERFLSKFPTYTADSARMTREQGELTSIFGVGAYELLRTATELFLLLNCRVNTVRELHGKDLADERARNEGFTPANLSELAQRFLGNNAYLRHVIEAAFPGDKISDNFFCEGVLTRTEPCLIELFYCYWIHEAGLAQSVAAISRRFQNQRARGPRDPLAHFELDPLRPLNNILWGYVQDGYKRVTIPRLSLECDHQYGLVLYGKANPGARAADSRSKFLESFHNLLHRCAEFYKADSDTTVIADGFPLLNALREVHLILAQGAHNQFGDMAWTARADVLIHQWIMARRETRDFLQSRAMVPYTEAWMPQVDTMKTLQGWTDVGVNHFRDLATFGEQLLLSIRYGDWVNIYDEDVAKDWARSFRQEAQSYMHSYRAVTGVDLTNADAVDYTVPGVHLLRRLSVQARARQ